MLWALVTPFVLAALSFSMCVFFCSLLIFLNNVRLLEEPLNLVFQNLLPGAKLKRGLFFFADSHVNSVFLVDFRAEVSGCFCHLRLSELIENC